MGVILGVAVAGLGLGVLWSGLRLVLWGVWAFLSGPFRGDG